MKPTTAVCTAILVYAGFSLRAGATDRYVAPGGTDAGAGTNAAAPWATLTNAVQRAASDDTIHVAPGTYTESEVYVRKNLAILGAGADLTIIQAAAAPGTATNRVFRFSSAHVYTLADLTVRHGRTLAGDGGGIRNDGMLTLIRVTVTNNAAAAAGGGIRSQAGSLTLDGCRIANNSAAESGGGIEIYHVALTVSNTTISGNVAALSGGGLYNNGSTGEVWNSSFIGNHAAGGNFYGGGGIANEGPLRLLNCTLSENCASQDGGGIRNNITNLTLYVEHCTIAYNTAANRGGGIDSNQGEPVVLEHTILGANQAPLSPDAFGYYLSGDYNLIQNPTGLILIGPTTYTIAWQDPRLGPLQDNGGPTWTHALATNSPALNAGYSAFAAPPATDQRGAPRVQRARIDIGAYELLDADQDGDGMDGQWEFCHGLNPTNAADKAGNPDGDAFDNFAEYTADTDPLAPDSFWHLDSLAVAGVAGIGFLSSSQRVYDLEWSGDLTGPSWAGLASCSNVAGNGGPFTLADTNVTARRYYRVKVRIP